MNHNQLLLLSFFIGLGIGIVIVSLVACFYASKLVIRCRKENEELKQWQKWYRENKDFLAQASKKEEPIRP